MNWQTISKKNNLTISIIELQELNLSNRLDAEHYQPHFMKTLNAVKKKNYKKLSKIVSRPITTGHTPSMKEKSFYGDEVKFIKTNNLRENRIVENFDHHLSEKGASKLKNALLKNDDIIVTIIGATPEIVGRVARVFPDLGRSAINQNISLIRPKIKSGYLACFLMGKYGRRQLHYLSRQTEQVNLNNAEVSDVLVPCANNIFTKKTHSLHNKTHDLFLESKQLYGEAEKLLLEEIKIEKSKSIDKNVSIRNLKDCLTCNRFDAEYWQPNFDVIIDKISQYKKGVSIIGDEAIQLKGVFKAKKDTEYSYIEIGDVNISTGEVEHRSIIGNKLPANAKIKLEKRQLIISKVRPNRGATAILDNHKGYIGSGAFTVLLEKDRISLQTLMVYLKTDPIKELLLRYNTGTSYPVITDDDILKLPIPLFDKQIQKKIDRLIRLSEKARQESCALLEKIKKSIEIYIEQDEKESLNYLNQ